MKPPKRCLALSVCFLIAPAVLIGCADEKPDTLVKSAKSYIEKGDNKSAVIQLKSALQKDPGSGEARFLLGRTLFEVGDVVSAKIELRKASELKYPDAAVLPVLARTLLLEGRYQKIVESYSSSAALEPTAAADLKTSVAAAYAAQGNRDRAEATLTSALDDVQGYAPAMLLQARLKADRRDFAAALKLTDQILHSEPGNHQAMALKGDLLLIAKTDSDGALKAYRQALHLKKDLVSAHASILEVLLSQNNVPAAKGQLAEMKKVLPNHPQTRFFEAQLAMVDKDYKTAKEISQLLLRVAPENVKVLVLAGAAELQAGSAVQAERFLSKAVQLSPSLPAPRRLLAQIYVRSSQLAKALEALAPLLETPEPDAEALSLAGQAYLQSGEVAKAEPYFARAVKINPTDSKSRTALALTQFSKGNVDLGFSGLQQIASSDNSTLADLALATAYLRQRNFDAALRAIDGLERKQPNKPIAANLRGQVQLERKDMAAARQSFEKALAIDPMYFPATANLSALDLADRKPEAAKKRFDRLLSAEPANLQALLAVAELRAKAGANADEVTASLANAAKLNPTAAEPRLLLMEQHVRNKNLKAALTVAEDSVAALPESALLLDGMGQVQMASGDFERAISTYIKLAALQRRSPQPYVRLAEAHASLKHVDAARESLNHALSIAPNFLPAQRLMIAIEIGAGRYSEALAIANTVKGQRANESAGYLLSGDVFVVQKNWNAAATAYRAVLKTTGGNALAVKLHALLMLTDKRADAQKLAAGWLKDHPEDPSFLYYLGDLAISQQDYSTAETTYLSVVRLQPDNAAALNNVAWVTSKLKKQGAIGYAERANALQPNQPAFLDTWSMILAENGQVARALETQKKVLALAPLNQQFRLNLAKLYIQAGEKALAKTELDRLAKLGDKFPAQTEVGEILKAL